VFRILLVEDDASQRSIMAAALKSAGYDVRCAESAEQALDILTDTKVDMAVCDVMMPGMDGFELTEQLRAAYRDMPIMIVTAKSEITDKEMGFHAGTDDYMVKPLDLSEFCLGEGAFPACAHRSRAAGDHRRHGREHGRPHGALWRGADRPAPQGV